VKVKKEPIKITPKTIVNSTKKTHTVKPGENLYRISLKYKMTAEKIKKLNRMKNNNIVVGQVLKLE
jgi:LysM repeat protein